MLIQLSEKTTMERQAWLQHAISPRPICFASTIDAQGKVNLSPFSFFNLFSSNPPIVVFSPSRRGRDNALKNTLENVLEVPEVVINIVDYNMVQQVSLSSCEYPKGVNEFEKAGFTQMPATSVRPPLVKEAPIQLECKVLEVKSLGETGGAGQLVIAEVICMHVADEVLNEAGTMIDQRKLDLVARCGGNWYARVNAHHLFEVEKPNTQLGMGIDALPYNIQRSQFLTGNHLGQLANLTAIPDIDPAYSDDQLKNIVQYYAINPTEMEQELHRHAARLLDQGRVADAWQVLLSGG
ncbi:MAG: flavin reductase family protein [Sphingobacteriia bacterium]|nr:MAG: flavin reductase family protein [Sphingobacteriia bacterium]